MVDPADVEVHVRRSQRQHDGVKAAGACLGQRSIGLGRGSQTDRSGRGSDCRMASARPACRSSGRASRPWRASRVPQSASGKHPPAPRSERHRPRKWPSTRAARWRAHRRQSARPGRSSQRRRAPLAALCGVSGAALARASGALWRGESHRHRRRPAMTPTLPCATGGDGREAAVGAVLAAPASHGGEVGRAAVGRGGGIASGGIASWRGISIGMSTGIGRGCVSNTSGKPMTPITSRTTAPIRRRRARVRACWTASAGSILGLSGAGSRFCLNMVDERSKPNASGCEPSPAQDRWRPERPGSPFSSTPPTA